MNTTEDFNHILRLIEYTINPDYLNLTQEIVLREVWNGKTYGMIADEYNYDSEYIKTVGCNLWQTLSRAFNQRVSKSNFVPFMRQKILGVSEKDNSVSDIVEFTSTNQKKQQKYYWNTAPSTKNFLGREEEIKLLETWSQETDCRCIIVSGMVGGGKTNLVAKFSQSFKDKFDYIIWYSLDSPPSIIGLLNSYLDILDHNSSNSKNFQSNDLSLLISQVIQYLKQNKVLLILDGLENILQTNKANIRIDYKKEFEAYSQFIRSVINTNHQSILICTTQIKHITFEYYGDNQIKFLELRGLKKQTIEYIVNSYENNLLNQPKLLQIADNFQNNPRLLKIVNDNIHIYNENNIDLTMHEFSQLEEITIFLERELNQLLDWEKEVIYWLSISHSPICLKDLFLYLELSKNKAKFIHNLNSLINKGLITQKENFVSLLPIMRSYLRRKLVERSLKIDNYDRAV